MLVGRRRALYAFTLGADILVFTGLHPWYIHIIIIITILVYVDNFIFFISIICYLYQRWFFCVKRVSYKLEDLPHRNVL
jgi:hypothetical protein